MNTLIGIDTGGTFTDFIVYENGEFSTLKIPSTPDAPEQAILQGLQKLKLVDQNYQLVHGTTVATNALLEGKGARTAFITNEGCKDLLLIGRQTRKNIYSLCPQSGRQLVDAQLCFEVSGRVAATGEVLQHSREEEIDALLKVLVDKQVEAVAVCTLFSFLNDVDEVAIEAKLAKYFFVSRSGKILPEQREYERGVLTWLNSFLGPKTSGYLSRLQAALNNQPIHVMQSDATTLPAHAAGQLPVRLLLSGPAGGVAAATAIAEQVNKPRLLTLDMGGTSTDVALIDGKPSIAAEAQLAEIPIAIPMLDIHTIGAGGGSIARVDEAGVLHVGPESAGALPGPACYAKGGERPTITDANMVLGRLPALANAESALTVDKAKAQAALTPLAEQLNCSLEEAALGVVALANTHMAQALRVISIHRGHDPAGFSLFPFGGSGTLHMCDVAQELGISEILVPVNAGVLSAYGMLLAPLGQFSSRSICKRMDQLSKAEIDQAISESEEELLAGLARLDIKPTTIVHTLELRYSGQASTLTVQWRGDIQQACADFTEQYQQQFGFQLENFVIELATLRVWASQEHEGLSFPQVKQGSPASPAHRVSLYKVSDDVPVYRREELVFQQKLLGPCIVLDRSGTIYIAPAWIAEVDTYGHIHLQIQAGDR